MGKEGSDRERGGWREWGEERDCERGGERGERGGKEEGERLGEKGVERALPCPTRAQFLVRFHHHSTCFPVKCTSAVSQACKGGKGAVPAARPAIVPAM